MKKSILIVLFVIPYLELPYSDTFMHSLPIKSQRKSIKTKEASSINKQPTNQKHSQSIINSNNDPHLISILFRSNFSF